MTKRVEKKLSAGGALTGLVGVVACLAVSASPALADDHGPAGGMRVYIDPSTGQTVATPPAGSQPLVLSPAEQNAASTSSDGLTPVPSAGSAGGVKVDLRGRFQSPLIATIGPDGKRVLHHDELPAAPAPTK